MPNHYFHKGKRDLSVGFSVWNLWDVPWKDNLLFVVCLVPVPVVAAVNWQYSSVDGLTFSKLLSRN